MNRRMQRQAAGFTLLEVLVAVGLLAIVLSIVYGLAAAMVAVTDHVADSLAENDRHRLVFERLNQDLAGIYQGESGYLLGRPPVVGDEPFLDFLSTASLTFAPGHRRSAVTRIGYYLRADPEGDSVSLWRSEQPVTPATLFAGLPAGPMLAVITGLKDVRLHYLDDQERFSTWDSRDDEDGRQHDRRFPAAVEVALDPDERATHIIDVRPAHISVGGG